MNKIVHIDEDNRVCVVILRNEWGNISAKGIARCAADDIFDKEKGLALANARAWAAYHKNALRYEKEFKERDDNWIKHHTKSSNKHAANIEALNKKLEKINKDLEELLKTL